MEKWHVFNTEEIEKKLNTSATLGLSRKDAEERIDADIRDGKKNRIPLYCKKRRNILSLVFAPFASVSYILYLAIALFAFFKDNKYFGAWAIALLLFQGICLGIFNLRSSRNKERTCLYGSPTVKVLRSGIIKYTDSQNIASGDVILLSKGDVIPCDARLIWDNALVVDEFIFDTIAQKLIRRRASKGSQKVYDENTSVSITDSQNIILAGSVIVSGEGRAIVISAGEDTILSAHLHNGEMSGDIKRPLGITKLLLWVQKIRIFSSIILLLITVAGMFSLRSQSFYTVFLMAISSVLYISVTLVDVWSKSFFSMVTERLPKGIIIKNNKVFDMLTGVSDVVLLGRAGLTDGELHISSMFLAGRKLDTHIIETKPDRTHRLCEYIYTYLKVSKNKITSQINTYVNALDSLMSLVEFDREGADLRLGSLYYIEDTESAFTETSGSNIRISVTTNDKIIDTCKYLRVGDMSAPIDSNLRDRIYHYIDECENTGDKLVFVVSEERTNINGKGQGAILEGILAFEEHIVEGLNETLEQYKEMGISLTAFMLDEGAESIKYLAQAGFISSASDNKIAFASQFAHDSMDITHNFGKYKAYLGFDTSEYAALLSHMRSQGKVVVSYGVEDNFNSVATLCDVSATCNIIEYDSLEYKESYFETFPDMGQDTSSLATPRGRLASGLLVRRNDTDGGLQGILHAADASSSAYINLSYCLKYFAIQASGIITLAILSVFSGFTLINPIQISALYLFISVVGLYYFANNLPKREMLRLQKRGYIALPEIMIRAHISKIATRAVAGFLFFVGALVLTLCGMISREGIAPSAFVALFTVGLIDMFTVSKGYLQKNSRKSKITFLIIISISVAAIILASAIGIHFVDTILNGKYAYLTRIPEQVIGIIYGGKVDLWSLVLIPAFVIECKILDVLCDKFHLRIKRKIKKTK